MSNNVSPSVILRSRVRLARNIVDYPFSPVLNDACRKEIIEKVTNSLDGYNYSRIDGETSQLTLIRLSEENRVSREFAKEKERHSLIFNEADGIYIMVCEEDHIRLQAFAEGLNLKTAGENALKVEKLLSSKLKLAYNNDLGYLTHCPTNLGTAMRASVMMFLPALTITKRMAELKTQLEKIGVTIRGIYGEGSAADAFIYQISNSLSLGISEADLLTKIETVALRIAEDELSARDALLSMNNDALIDKIMRSVGILKYAHILSGAEFLDCFSYARLGITLGLVNDIKLEKLDALLFSAMPAHIIEIQKEASKDTALRDRLRAKTVKDKLQEV